MNIHLSGKTAVITGSTSGIGKAVAETLAQQGVRVAVHGRDAGRGEQMAADIRKHGGEAMFLQADLLDPQAPAQMVSRIVRDWGRIDFVINNAALVCNKTLEEIRDEDWNDLLAVNLKAPFFLIQAALPWLKENRGAVVNVSSVNGIRNKPNNLIYDTIKAALNHMTQGLALDLREAGVRCNALMPGGVATPLINSWFRQFTENPEEAERLAEQEKSRPFMGTPQQIADAVLYLCSGQSSWINGAVIPIDGGFHIG